MYYSLNLLKHFISVDDTAQNIANNLTFKSCEIEEVITRKIPDDVLIGKAIEVKQHPNADKLVVCQIDCGDKGVFQICTGGTNIKQGDFVPTAIPGCYLPVVDLKISPRPMRGEESNGMICSKDELGIKEDSDKHRIWVLDEDFDDLSEKDLGLPLGTKYPRLNNILFDVDNKTITHRPDLTGHFGLATELFAIYPDNKIKFHKLKDLYQQFNDTNVFNILSQGKQTDIKLDIQTKAVRSYILLNIKDIDIKQSTLYTRIQVLDSDSTPKNNWVDFSNLFMLISGQPIHFFDADKVEGGIVVRQANENEKFIDLFDNEHILNKNDLVIADDMKILALAGVVGGKDSGITENTKNILVEIANFDPVMIRKTSQKIGLRTDAVMRFEKNISSTYTLYMFELFMDMLSKYKNDLGKYKFDGSKTYFDDITKNNIYRPKNITLNIEKMKSIILGNTTGKLDKSEDLLDDSFLEQSKKILSRLGFKLETITDKKTQKKDFFVKVPQRRSTKDISIQEDIIEEIARIYGYDNIESQTLYSSLQPNTFLPFIDFQRKIEELLVLNGEFDQMETYPWIEEKILDSFDVDKEKLLSLQNPVSPEQKYMRDSMIYNLLTYVKKNHKFYDEFNLFDIGKVWRINKYFGDLNHDDFFPDNISEDMVVGMISYDKNSKNTKNYKSDLFLKIKSQLDILLKSMSVFSFSLKTSKKDFFHPNKQGRIIMNNKYDIGYICELHPNILDKMKISTKGQVVYAEINITKIIENQKKQDFKSNIKYNTLKDQIVDRDLCFVINDNEFFDKIINAVSLTQGIENVDIFDVYKGENLPNGKKSIALTITIKGDGKMNTEEINNIMNNAIKNVEKIGGELRE